VNSTLLHLYFIKPSKYDDDGYVIRYGKGVMPSNTVAVLYGLTLDLVSRGELPPGVKVNVDLIDELVTRVDVGAIAKRACRAHVKTLVCLCGVQTNMFARAADLALEFRSAGVDVAIGGFHVSGVIALFPHLPPDLEELRHRGVTLVAGEVEDTWGEILNDFLSGRLQSVYNFMDKRPALKSSSIPAMPRKYMKRYFLSSYGTLDCGRGCPFNCSFCCIINVQGRAMRFRAVTGLKERLRENYHSAGIRNYFFTDDNFSRNKNWERIFDIMTELREEEQLPLGFMMQIDTKAYRIENFVSKAARAGCTQVFIGIESLNQKNLEVVCKTQNDVDTFKEMNDLFVKHHITTHAAYIIGFPRDTAESVREDIRRLMDIGFMQASFFILTPLPGSVDHKKLLEAGAVLDADYNNYDTFNHQVMKHPRLAAGEVIDVYKEVWRTFYGKENMKRILARSSPDRYYSHLGTLFWYKHAVYVDEIHPLISGFLRKKDRRTRRPLYPREPFFAFYARRARDMAGRLKRFFSLLVEFEEIWLATRPRTGLENKIVEELKRIKAGIRDRIRFRDLIAALKNAGPRAAAFKARYILRKFLPFVHPVEQRLLYTRSFLNRFWSKTRALARRGRLYLVNPFKLVAYAVHEVQLALGFGLAFLRFQKRNKALLDPGPRG
jgi:radical SAM superfamily enzyme YgiQ (UPF0313 family)